MALRQGKTEYHSEDVHLWRLYMIERIYNINPIPGT
jgi:hypothetical protein